MHNEARNIITKHLSTAPTLVQFQGNASMEHYTTWTQAALPSEQSRYLQHITGLQHPVAYVTQRATRTECRYIWTQRVRARDAAGRMYQTIHLEITCKLGTKYVWYTWQFMDWLRPTRTLNTYICSTQLTTFRAAITLQSLKRAVNSFGTLMKRDDRTLNWKPTVTDFVLMRMW